MVNAAVNIKYGKDFYEEGTKLPNDLVEHFAIHNPSLLDDHIEINGTWKSISDSTIAGFVEENKSKNYRIRKYFERYFGKKEEIKSEEKPKEIASKKKKRKK